MNHNRVRARLLCFTSLHSVLLARSTPPPQGCRKKSRDSLCSGHGACVALNHDTSVHPGGNAVGTCSCAVGYAGALCERDLCGSFSPSVVGSGCSGHGKCVQSPALVAGTPTNEPRCECDVGWGRGSAESPVVGDQCKTVFAGNLLPVIYNSSDKEMAFYVVHATFEVEHDGYRMSMATKTAKKVNIFKASVGARVFMVVLASLGCVMSIVYLVLVRVHRKKRVIGFAQPTFLYVVLIGSFLSYFTVFLNTNGISTTAQCYASLWSGHLSFTLVFSVLFAKTYRLYKLFKTSTKSLKKVVITKMDVFKYVLSLRVVRHRGKDMRTTRIAPQHVRHACSIHSLHFLFLFSLPSLLPRPLLF